MSREKESYKDNLERIKQAFPDREVLTIAEVARWMKRDPRTVKRELPFTALGISVATLARQLSA